MTTIGITPRYPAHAIRLVDGIPRAADPETGAVLPPARAARIRHDLREGERATFTARVANFGGAGTGPFHYRWLWDGREVGRGEHPGLQASTSVGEEAALWRLPGRVLREVPLRPGTFADLSITRAWRKGTHRIRLEVALQAETPEVSGENNAREERTDARSYLVLVRRADYDRFARTRGAAGTWSFEDWLQHHVGLLRRRFRDSAVDSAPEGVREDIRIDMIRVLADDESAGAAALHAGCGWDAVWEYRGGTPPADPAGEDPDVPAAWIDLLGIADLSRLQIAPAANGVVDPETGRPVRLGSRNPLHASSRAGGGGDRRAALFRAAGAGGGAPLPEHTVLALNRMVGQRRGYRGTCLYDLPRSCRVRILDNEEQPIAGAHLRFYQAREGAVPDETAFAGETDAAGNFTLPNRPAPRVTTGDGFTQRDNPFGSLDLTGANGLFLVRVAARGRAEYHWLPVTAFNIAFWRGEEQAATLPLRTRVAAPGGPAAPAALRAEFRTEDRGPVVRLSWQPVLAPDLGGYFIYRAAPPDYAWVRAGTVLAGRVEFVDRGAPEEPPAPDFRYAVTAVTTGGRESDLSPVAGLQPAVP